jgi:multiple sugar transport system substrate-binding protein
MVDLIGNESPPGVTTYIEQDTQALFQNGHAVFLRNWMYVWRLIEQGNAGVGIDQVGFTPMVSEPNHKRAASLGGWGFAISRFTSNREAAWRLVEFMTRPESLAHIRQHVGRVPARKSQVPPEFLPILLNARPRPSIPEYAQASNILQRWLSAALTRRMPPVDALGEAARETRLLLESQ